MLLSIMRKQAKSWLIKLLIGIIAVVFIFYFGYSFTARQGLKIAYVNGELISGMEYQKTYRELVESMRRQYKSIWNDSLIKPVLIERNQFSTLSSYGHLSEPEKFDIESHMSWMNNEIRFQQASVAEVLSQLKRWYDYEFIVEDETRLNEQVTVHIVKTNVPDVLQIERTGR